MRYYAVRYVWYVKIARQAVLFHPAGLFGFLFQQDGLRSGGWKRWLIGFRT